MSHITNGNHWPRQTARGLLGSVALVVLPIVTVGCAHVPQEAITLSQRMGQDLVSVHTANRQLARSYFATLRAQADAVVDKEYRPFVLEASMDDLLHAIDDARKPGSPVDPLDVMQVFVEEATARIDSFRAEVHAPIDAQEREVLNRIDAAHESLGQANAAITAHLISLRKVESEQDTLMRQAGLPADVRARLSGELTQTSDEVGQLLRNARKGSAALDSLPGKLQRVLGHR